MTAPASSAQPVLWHEGLFLHPQHFLQLERHRLWHLTTLLNQVTSCWWGLTMLAIDRQSLSAGRFVLIAAEGILPDGLPFSLGAQEPALSRDVHAPAGTGRIGVRLAISADHPGEAQVSPEGMIDGRPCRWRRVARHVHDELSGVARVIDVLSPHLRLVFDGEPLENTVSLKIGELMPSIEGGLTLCDDWCPPTLRLSGSPVLRACMRRIEAAATASAERIAGQRRMRPDGLLDFAPADQAALMTLQVLSGTLPGLVALDDAHPARAHELIARLAGMLAALSTAPAATSLPTYRHDAPLGAFLEIERVIIDLLGQASCARSASLPLRTLDDRVMAATLPDYALAPSRLFVGLSTDMPSERVAREIPLKAKIGAIPRIEHLITQSLRGLRISHLALAPPEIAARRGWHYFEIGREGDEWKHVAEARGIAIYVPPDCAPAALELLVVRK